MITVTGAKGLVANPKVSPEVFAASIAGGFKSACPDTFVAKGLGPTKLGDQEAYVAVASCGSVVSSPDKHSETALVVAVKGSADYYTLQWAERDARFGQARHRRGEMAGRGCASCSRSASVRSSRASPRPIRAASARASRGVSKG